jgi:LuxR family maltose regulon positive regulatory protein
MSASSSPQSAIETHMVGAGPYRRNGDPTAPPLARALAFELLESKLQSPPGRGTVSREGLVGLVEGSRSTPVVFLSAAPGWGKTTLLAQWASRSQRPFAWVSVDENDNDPIVLLTYVAVALDRVSRLDAGVFDALASPGVSVEATVAPRLGAALAAMDEAVVLVLDDLQLVDSRSCLDAIAVLSRHVPEGSQLVLSARGRPALPLGALRARGLALEIGQRDLRMDEEEAGRLLSAAGVELPDEQVAELTEQTEGWPAGMYLAALSIRARGVKANGTATFSGSDRLVSDYLRSELLAHLSTDELQFLMRTAVLERMSGPLCDAVLETSGSAAELESLERSNLFLVPLDGL